MAECLIVGAGGAVGAVLRYLIGLIPLNPENGFPIKTFLINVAGCFVIGLVAALAARASLNPRITLFLKVGICGGFTTFSSFALETGTLIKAGNYPAALAYALLSLALGILTVFAGEAAAGLR